MVGVDNPAAVATSALLMSLLVQALKNSPLVPWMNRQTGTVNLLVSFVSAIISAGVIHYAWDVKTGDVTFVLNVHLVWAFIVQWGTQHAAYKGLIVPTETLGDIRALLQRALPPPINEAEAKAHDAKQGGV
jgi:hypothetical protein